MSVYLGKGDGSFAFQSNSLSVGKNGCFVLRDFNRDGCDDILGATGVLAISNNGVFSSTSNAWAPVGTGPIVASDFNNDGYLDIMRIESAATISFNFGNGDGTFGATTQTAGSSTFALAAGDFNGDGVVDGAYGTAANTEVRLANTTQNTWIQHFDLLTQSGARQALSDLDSTLLRVNKNLASMGASMSRLGSALNTLSATRDNYTAARSRIMDVDVAAEAAQMVRNQVLQQSASALLAQANQQPSLVLQLLN
jgi:flagellin